MKRKNFIFALVLILMVSYCNQAQAKKFINLQKYNIYGKMRSSKGEIMTKKTPSYK